MEKQVVEKSKFKILRIFNNKNSRDEIVKQIILIKNTKGSNAMSERR